MKTTWFGLASSEARRGNVLKKRRLWSRYSLQIQIQIQQAEAAACKMGNWRLNKDNNANTDTQIQQLNVCAQVQPDIPGSCQGCQVLGTSCRQNWSKPICAVKLHNVMISSISIQFKFTHPEVKCYIFCTFSMVTSFLSLVPQWRILTPCPPGWEGK